jgi:DNA replication ATP-dependent helicase Dna2
MTSRSEVINAVQDELARSSPCVEFEVAARRREGKLWSVFVDLSSATDPTKGLDEAYEEATAWWVAKPKNGAADVLSVIPENQQINLRYATTTPPEPGDKIRLYPPRYLEALRVVWMDVASAEASLAWLEKIRRSNPFLARDVPTAGPFSGLLRKKQCEAFDLMGFSAGFLWGPPGTGKTFTLGTMLAQYLVSFPTRRVLLLSTTNTATDQALVSVDKALESISVGSLPAQVKRLRCTRIGNHFVASQYVGRNHLLPTPDGKLLARLVELESQRPAKSALLAYADWMEQDDRIRDKLRQKTGELIDASSLAAMTTTSAAFNYDQLVARAPFDLIVFDEASQVGKAHALIVARLAKHVVFAGDPNQLAPIVQSSHRYAEAWLGTSMFAEMRKDTSATCLLVEQSRMTPDICTIVSNCFYDGKLVVAGDKVSDREWLDERRLLNLPGVGTKAVHLESIGADGIWSEKYRGPIRFDSAKRIQQLVLDAVRQIDESEILVLTPFRAQRTLVRTMLESKGIKRVKVSTVHRAQGSERHTVIFDVVQGGNKFLSTDDARRLVNVALSRAKARLIVVLSPGDRSNQLFEQVATVIEHLDDLEDATPIGLLAQYGNFPYGAVGQKIRVNNVVGEILDIVGNGEKFRVRDFATGQVKTFKTKMVLAKSSSPTGGSLQSRQQTSRAMGEVSDTQGTLGRSSPCPSNSRSTVATTSSYSANPSSVPSEQMLVAMMDADVWFSLAHWAKVNDQLSGWDRQFCFSQGRRAKSGALPSDKQKETCERILAKAKRLGFEFDGTNRHRPR